MAKDIRKKLADDGGSQPSRVEIITIYKDFNSKLQYFIRTLNDHYIQNPNFYLQRTEFNALRDIIWKDCVWCVNAPMFDYNGIKHAVIPQNIEGKYVELLRLNKIYVFHNIERHVGGEILIHGKYL